MWSKVRRKINIGIHNIHWEMFERIIWNIAVPKTSIYTNAQERSTYIIFLHCSQIINSFVYLYKFKNNNLCCLISKDYFLLSFYKNYHKPACNYRSCSCSNRKHHFIIFINLLCDVQHALNLMPTYINIHDIRKEHLHRFAFLKYLNQ